MDRRWLCLVWALSATTCSDIPVNHEAEDQCGCVAERVRLSPVGAPVETTTTVAPCRMFTLDVSAIGDRRGLSCSVPMTCPGQLTGITVEKAVKNPDVQAALRASGTRFGAGPDLPGGGAVYRIEVGAAQFEIAAPCEASDVCTPIPTGVQALLDLLLAVNLQEQRRSPCREALGL